MFLIFFVVSADPLKRLVLKKMGIPCVGREVRKSFHKLKNLVANAPVLAFFL